MSSCDLVTTKIIFELHIFFLELSIGRGGKKKRELNKKNKLYKKIKIKIYTYKYIHT